jgi:hypothetical protein
MKNLNFMFVSQQSPPGANPAGAFFSLKHANLFSFGFFHGKKGEKRLI